MNSSNIEFVCFSDKQIKKFFRGVFAKNIFESSFSNYCMPNEYNIFIVNSQDVDNTAPHSHWLLFLISNTKNIYFDSYGKDLSFYNFQLPNFNWETADFRCQSSDSNLCGAYCIFMAYWLSLGKSLRYILNKYFCKDQLRLNDRFIIHFIKFKGYYPVLLKTNPFQNNDWTIATHEPL